MSQDAISQRIQNLLQVTQPVLQFIQDSRWAHEQGRDPQACDFVLGNPHEMPLADFTEALRKWSVPHSADWYAYKMSEPESQQIVAASLRQTHGLDFDPDDICMTSGAFAAIAIALGTITDPGDEIIYISPPWFFYETLIAAYQGRPVRVPCDRATFDLDLAAIQAAITPRTRGIIVNSPNNPTGRIYPPETLQGLANLLEQAGRRHNRTIYLLSDESYNRIVYDEQPFPSPVAFYPRAFLLYTYGKTLLTPGQRIGYIAMPPGMPDRDVLRPALTLSALANGYSFPNALLQHALGDLDRLSINVQHLQRKRDRMVEALGQMGYALDPPQGTFYLLVHSPLADDQAFIDLLADEKIYCLPGAVFELPGYFRISLTASDGMIERSLAGFERVMQKAKEQWTENA